MKRSISLGLFALALTVQMVFTAGAGATTLTSPTGTVATPTIKAESEGHVVISNAIANIECNWSFEGSVSFHSAGNVAMLPLTSITPSTCTNSWHVTVGAAGALTVDWTSGYNGAVRSTGLTLSTTRFGVTCTYVTNNTKIGTLTGGSPATIHLEGVIPGHNGSSALCGSEARTLTGSYKVASPTSVFVDKDGTSLTSPTDTVVTPTIKAESEGYVVLDKEPGNIECTSTIEGNVESHGLVEPVSGIISSFAFTGCKDLWHVTVSSPGMLTVEWTSGYSGTIRSSGLTIEATRQGIACYFATSNTQIGEITGGTPATVHLAASIPLHSGSHQSCGSSSRPLTGSYVVTKPTSLFVDPA